MDSLSRRALAAALALFVLLPAAAAAQTAAPERPPFDSRTREPVAPAAPDDPAAIRAADRLSARLGRQGVVDVDARTGTPRMVARLDGSLTGASESDPERIVIDYVRAQRGVFALSDDDLAGLRLVRRYTDDAGTTHLEWAQTWHGITAFDNGLQAAVAADGRLINVSGSPLPDLATRSAEPKLTAGQALARALGGGLAPRQESQRGSDRHTTFSGGHDARLVLFADRAGDVHLAWRVTANVAPTEVYDTVVDADGGDLLFRSNSVDFVDAKVHAYAAYAGVGAQLEHTLPVVDQTRLFGPYAHAYADLDSDNVVDSGEESPASSNPPPTWDYDFTASGVTNKQRSAAQLYYFVNEFRNWLAAAPFGFTAASGGFEDGDRVIAETLDGAALPAGPRNNAFMSTPPDGQSPRMSMFLWTSPDRDSSDDASVVFHEYAHGLTSRLVTDSSGNAALDDPQADAMGEGWSDWYALDYLVEHGHETDTAAPGELELARHANGGDGIRSEPLDCPVGSNAAECAAGGAGGYTYGDFGRIAGFTEEHRNGEIWSQTLWDLRGSIGADAARRVVTGGLRLAPDDPSMLEMRNAIIQAGEQPPLNGAHRAAIWQVFANRGMGYFAVSHRGTDAAPRENFDVPGPGTTVSGRVTDAQTGAPVAGALVRLASTVSGFPGDLTGVSDSNGNYTISNVVPGTYPRPLVDAARYSPGFAPDVQVPSGGRTLDVQLVRSWASSSGGAVASIPDGQPDFTSSGCGPGGAIDLSHTTGWGSTSHNARAPFPAGAKSITITLPQTIDVSAFNIDPAEICGDESSAATSKFTVETSPDGVKFTEAASGQFTTDDNHRPNVIAPTAGAKAVRFVRYTMLEPQSQVDRTGTANDDDGIDFMDTTEFEVYGAPAATGGGATNTATPTTDPPPTTGGIGLAAIDRTPPSGSLRLVAGQRLRTVLARGMKMSVNCNEPCSGRFSVRLDARTAKRLKLLPRRSLARSVRVAVGTLRMGEGRRTATLEFTAKARRALRGQRSVKLSVAGSLTDRSGNSGSRGAKFTIRR